MGFVFKHLLFQSMLRFYVTLWYVQKINGVCCQTFVFQHICLFGGAGRVRVVGSKHLLCSDLFVWWGGAGRPGDPPHQANVLFGGAGIPKNTIKC